jgi:hypothetical protein
MAGDRRDDPWRPGRDIPFFVLCAAVALTAFRSIDQPAVDIGVAGTDVTFVPTDMALVLLGILCAGRLLGRGALPRPSRAVALAASAFAGWLLLSSLANGAGAVVGAGKLLEYGVVALGAVLFVQRRAQFFVLLAVVVLVTGAAVLWALPSWLDAPGDRQQSFMGEHDFAAVGALALCVGLARLYVRRGPVLMPLAAGVLGALAVTLGAALASLLGLYLAVVALAAVAAVRGRLTLRAVGASVAVAAVVTAGALALRSGDLGFLDKWFGDDSAETAAAEPGRYAGSWSQRLIYAYIGGRVFLANTVLGTGWHGELPPEEWARFLPDARERFADQPPHYFPRADQRFTPQQTYDQVLFELGIVGAALFVWLAVVVVRAAASVGRRWPRDDPDELIAYVPAAWTASIAGALAGAALFGGIPLVGFFWLVLGAVALAPSLVPVRSARRHETPRELALARS